MLLIYVEVHSRGLSNRYQIALLINILYSLTENTQLYHILWQKTYSSRYRTIYFINCPFTFYFLLHFTDYKHYLPLWCVRLINSSLHFPLD